MNAPSTAKTGAFKITTLWDGDYPCDAAFLPAAGSPAGEALFRSAGLPPSGPSQEPINAFAIERDGKLWLVDAGLGTAQPGFGRVPDALRALGHRPEAVETIVMTHLHEDHIGGLVEGGAKSYSRARVLVPEAELRFWRDPEAPATSREPPAAFQQANAFLDLYGDAIESVADGSAFAPGLSFLPLPGHTPGHSGVMVEDRGERLLIWADIAHSELLQLPHPEWSIERDNDPGRAVATRHALLADLATSGLRIAGSHLAGIGRIRRAGQGYALEPTTVPSANPDRHERRPR